MRLAFAMTILGGLTIVIGACSSDSATVQRTDSTGSPTPDVNSEEFVAAAQVTAANSLLILEDYPEGWTQTPKDPDEPKLGLTGECAVLEDDGLPGDVAHAESDEFTGVADQNVSTGSSVFADAAKAEEAFSDYAATIDACRDEYTEAYRKALEDEFAARGLGSESISDLAVTFDLVNSAVSADDVLPYRLLTMLTASGKPLQFNFDVMFLRQGKVVGYLSYYSPSEPPVGEEEQLSETLSSKMREAASRPS